MTLTSLQSEPLSLFIFFFSVWMPTQCIGSSVGPSSLIVHGEIKQGQLTQPPNLRCTKLALSDICHEISSLANSHEIFP